MLATLSRSLLPLAILIAGLQPADARSRSARKMRGADLHRKARQLRALVHKTARLRQLWPKRRIAMGVMSREQILAQIRARLAKEYSDEEIAIDSAVLQRLGLLARGIDFKRELLDLLSDQVAGFYDPRTRKLNIADWLPLGLQKVALVHEICHALQDQYFGLKRFVTPIKDSSDRQLARLALAEGDCTGVMIEHLIASSGQDLGSLPQGSIDQVTKQVTAGNQSKVFKAAPAFIRQSLTFPYVFGLKFVRQIRRRHSWKQVNRVFRRLPASTEQILHYDKYLRREHPARIAIRKLAALAETHRLVKRETLGEYQLRLLAALALTEEAAERAAAGWGGDRLAAYLPKTATQQPDTAPAAKAASSDRPAGTARAVQLPLIVHLSTWDSEADAIEFANAERRVLARDHRAQPSGYVDLSIYRDSHGLQSSVQRQGAHVLLLLAAPEPTREQLQGELWRRWTIAGRRVRVKLESVGR